jgi:phosphoesterase RecJ-like protein
VKISFRSVGNFDVAKFASQFGGGGHSKASGASIAGSMEDVQRQVLGAARAALAPAR